MGEQAVVCSFVGIYIILWLTGKNAGTLKALLEKLQDVGEKAEYLNHRSLQLVQENRNLRHRLLELEADLKAKDGEIRDLTEKLELAKLARGMEVGNSAQSEELKNKINEYIREIDQCLKLIGD